MTRRPRSALIILVAAAAFLALASPASAALITPTTTVDEFNTGSACSLREAIEAANTNAAFGGCPAGSGADEIRLGNGTYLVTAAPSGPMNDNADGDLSVPSGSTISFTHLGIAPATIQGSDIDRLFDLELGSSVRFSRLTLSGGHAVMDAGGAIENAGTLVIENSTITGNRADGFAGAIEAASGTTTISNSTISGNRANSDSGGIDIETGAVVTLNNVTLTGNVADADNTGTGDGGGLHVEGGSFNLNNTIVAGNSDLGGQAPDCDDGPISQGNNLIGNPLGCAFVAGPTDRVGANPMLGPLANNGGPTLTHALLLGSQAIDGAGADATPADQRGAPRSAPDIGAYERVICGKAVVNRVGTTGKDKLKGTPGADGILGLNGKDTLLGLAGKDGLCGGGSRDTLKGGNGKDRLIGQKGPDRMFGGKGNDSCKGGSGKDEEASC